MNGHSPTRLFVLAGLLVGLALVLLVSPLASSSPDGLEKVAEEEGFADRAEESDGPLADYQVEAIDDEGLSTAASGAVGLLLTFGIGTGVVGLLRVLRTRDVDDPDGATAGTAAGG